MPIGLFLSVRVSGRDDSNVVQGFRRNSGWQLFEKKDLYTVSFSNDPDPDLDMVYGLIRLGMECVADRPEQAPPHVCYHAQFGRSSLKSVVIDRGAPPLVGVIRSITSIVYELKFLIYISLPFPVNFLLVLHIPSPAQSCGSEFSGWTARKCFSGVGRWNCD